MRKQKGLPGRPNWTADPGAHPLLGSDLGT